MTGAKVKQVLQFYLDHFRREDREAGLAPVEPRKMSDDDTLRKGPEVGDVDWAAHLNYMCVEAQKFVDEGRVEKAMRWLGFLQGVLWESGEFSLDDLKNHSRPDGGAEGDGGGGGRPDYVVSVFRGYDCYEKGVRIGKSVLSSAWTDHDVLRQLAVDGCPLGMGAVVKVVGWPGYEFRVEVVKDGKVDRTYRFELSRG